MAAILAEQLSSGENSELSGAESDGGVSDDGDSGIDDSQEHRFASSGLEYAPSQEGAGQDGPPRKRVKLSKSELYKPPTSDELIQLKETQNLFHSSLVRMQITELLGEVQLKPKRRRQIDEYIKQLCESLKALPALERREITDQAWVDDSVKVPFRQVPYQVKGSFRFLPPGGVHVVGSYALGTCIKPNVTVDLALEIPRACFHSDDFLNLRYFRKRALYLTFVAMEMKKYEIVEKLEFTRHHGNQLKPVLVITPAGGLGKHVKIHLHTTPEEGTFKLNRFDIRKNSVRKSWYHGTNATDEESSLAPTPGYNTAVLQDMIHCKHTEHVLQHVQHAQGVRDGIALLRVWLHQRQLDKGRGAMTGALITAYVTYLISCKKINLMMSSYQVMRNTLLQLCKASWDTDPITLSTFSTPDRQRTPLDAFSGVHDLVFTDATGYLNLAADMSLATLNVIRHEASLALQYLETPGLDGFDVLFMRPVSFLCKADQLIHIQTSALKKNVKTLGLQDALLDHHGDYVHTCTHSLLRLLDKAVGRRVRLVHHKFSAPKQWSIGESPPGADDVITIGFLVNPETFTSIVEKGPPADTEEAKDFQSFWGEVSELRRFQDGSICEAVLWSGTTLSDKRRITGKAVTHTLQRHANIPKSAVTYVAAQLDGLLKIPQWQQRNPKTTSESGTNQDTPEARKTEAAQESRDTPAPYGTGEEQHGVIRKVYDELSKQLRNMEGFPQAIHSIQGTSPVFRYAEVFPAIPCGWRKFTRVEGKRRVPDATWKCPPHVPAINVMCILEPSGKWPELVDAVKRLKAAFHVKLGEILREKHQLTNAVFPTHVDVLKDGYVFRVVIGYMKEIALQRLVTTPDGMVRNQDTPEAAELQRHLVTLPKLTTMLLSIQQHHPSYSGTVRLVKRWIGAQMFLHHMAPEVVELVVAHLFLHPAPYSVTSSPHAGFLRFLKLMASHDWNTTPLIVNLNDELTKQDYANIERLFNKNRSTLPLMYVATPLDKFRSEFTRKHPTAPILQRLSLLAKQSSDVLEKQLMDPATAQDFKLVFRPPLEVFDVIIHLKLEQLSRQHQAVDPAPGTFCPRYTPGMEGAPGAPLPVYDYNPAELYLEELQETFDRHALFFHDSYGGNIIGVVWKPAAFIPQDFKTSAIEGAMLTSGVKPQLVPNTEAIVNDLKIMGAGLVERIETKTDKWRI